MESYLKRVQEVFSRKGWTRTMVPATLLDDWRRFVELCLLGYPDNIYEYYNDIRVREWIELILTAEQLNELAEQDEFKVKVEEVDQQFRNLLLPQVTVPGKSFWWEKGVLKYAGEELVNDYKKEYDIEIARIGHAPM